MNSATLPSFWTAYRLLEEDLKPGAKKAFRVWAEHPFHRLFKWVRNPNF